MSKNRNILTKVESIFLLFSTNKSDRIESVLGAEKTNYWKNSYFKTMILLKKEYMKRLNLTAIS
jgi:hypothetical protein